MFKVQSQIQATVCKLTISGVIDETFTLARPTEPQVKEVHVYCKEVVRINSVGVKAWMKFFQSLQAMNLKVIYREVSPVLVEQFNMIANFSMGGTLESMMVPFCCESCKAGLVGAFTAEKLRQIPAPFPSTKCPKCGGVARFDDFEEEYFSCLKRSA
jgi:hypothetical protein